MSGKRTRREMMQTPTTEMYNRMNRDMLDDRAGFLAEEILKEGESVLYADRPDIPDIAKRKEGALRKQKWMPNVKVGKRLNDDSERRAAHLRKQPRAPQGRRGKDQRLCREDA